MRNDPGCCYGRAIMSDVLLYHIPPSFYSLSYPLGTTLRAQLRGTNRYVAWLAAHTRPLNWLCSEEEMEHVCNSKVARYQTIKKIQILPDVVSVDSGELTPTLKVKRNIVNEKYASEIAAFYA
jgi:long-subunit acyl-CoA synthetase (AMP-forming)